MRALAILWSLLLALALVPATASADRPFSSRFVRNTQGDIAIAANGLESCVSSEPICPAVRNGTAAPIAQNNNNARVMTYVDTDSDPATFDSSEATLALPAGARVLFAGLYYGARLAAGSGGAPAPNAAARGTVLLRAPGDADYRTLSASQIDTASDTYQGFVDVTSIIDAAGPGDYRVANVQAGTGKSDGQLAGWSLVVAYGDPAAPSRNLSVFDGLQNVNSANPVVTIGLSGFTTPQTGPVNSAVGLIAYEGDLATTGDGASIRNGSGGFTPLANAANPANNLFNSSISTGGVNVTTRDPAYVNQLGFDANLFSLPAVLGNNQTSTDVRLTTSGDAYQPGVVTIATDLFAPKIQATKTVDQATANVGDTLTYTVSLRNTGQDGATNLVLSDPLPDGTIYVPGSLQIDGATRTDGAGDDQGEYNAAGRRIVARLGSGATATAGGALAVGGGPITVRFQARIDATVGLASGTVIDNRAQAAFAAATTGTPDAGVETAPAQTTIRAPDLGLRKSHPGTFVPGGTSSYRLDVENLGDGPSVGLVTVTDTVSADFIFTGAPSGTGWTCGVSGQTVTCTRSDALAPGASYPTITLPVRVRAGAIPGNLTNTATLVNGSDSNPENDTATDEGAVSQPSIDLVVTKTLFVQPQRSFGFQPGELVVWQVNVENRGVSDAASAVLTDDLPAPLAFEPGSGADDCSEATCPLGTIASGETVTRYVIAQLPIDPQSFPSETLLTNRVSVAGTGEEDNPDDNDDADTIRTAPVSDAFVQKSFSPTQPLAGGPVTYTLVVGDSGPAVSDLSVTDSLPAALRNPQVTVSGGSGDCTLSDDTTAISCVVPQVAPGTQRVITITGTLAPGSAGAPVSNTASVSTGDTTGELDSMNNFASASFTPRRVDLGLTKTRLDTGPVPVGGETSFRLTARNGGDGTGTGVAIRDELPPGLTALGPPAGCEVAGSVVTCRADTLGPGAEVSFDIRARAEASVAGQTLTNVANVSSSSADLDGSNDNARLDVPIGPALPPPPPPTPPGPGPPGPAPSPPSVDLAIRVLAPSGGFRVGDRTRWRLEVSNLGSSTATGVRVGGTPTGGATVPEASIAQAGCTTGPPVDCELGTLASGATRTVAVTLRPTRAGVLRLTGTVRGNEPETRSDNNSDSGAIRVLEGLTSLSVTSVAKPTSVGGGGLVTLTVAVRTTGRPPAQDVKVCQRLPDGLSARRFGGARLTDGVPCWRVRSLGAGKTRSFVLTARAGCLARKVIGTARARAGNARVRRAAARLTIACRPRAPGFTG